MAGDGAAVGARGVELTTGDRGGLFGTIVELPRLPGRPARFDRLSNRVGVRGASRKMAESDRGLTVPMLLFCRGVIVTVGSRLADGVVGVRVGAEIVGRIAVLGVGRDGRIVGVVIDGLAVGAGNAGRTEGAGVAGRMLGTLIRGAGVGLGATDRDDKDGARTAGDDIRGADAPGVYEGRGLEDGRKLGVADGAVRPNIGGAERPALPPGLRSRAYAKLGPVAISNAQATATVRVVRVRMVHLPLLPKTQEGAEGLLRPIKGL